MKFYLAIFSLVIFCGCIKQTVNPDLTNTMSADVNGIRWNTQYIQFTGSDLSKGPVIITGTGANGVTITLELYSNKEFTAGTYNFRPTGVDSVTLSSLTATLMFGSGIVLNWSTSKEVNLDSFDVQRSSDGVNFTTIGTVTAVGNSTATNNYSFNDSIPLQVVSYYRLMMVNADGTSAYSSNIKVDNSKVILASYNGTTGYNGTLQVIKNDTINHIHTGTFSFDCILTGNDTVHVTNGTFDVQY